MPTDLFAELAKHPLFEQVEESIVSLFAQQGTLRITPPETKLCSENDTHQTCFILLRGSVKLLFTSHEGVEAVMRIFTAPAILADLEAIAHTPHLSQLRTVEKSLLLSVPAAVVTEAISSSPVFCRNLLRDVAQRFCVALQAERALAFDPVEVRLCQVLLNYLELYGVPVTAGVKIRVPLSQDDLANNLGVNRRSITRALKKLTAGQIIGKQGRHYVVFNPEAVQRGADPHQRRILQSAMQWGPRAPRRPHVV